MGWKEFKKNFESSRVQIAMGLSLGTIIVLVVAAVVDNQFADKIMGNLAFVLIITLIVALIIAFTLLSLKYLESEATSQPETPPPPPPSDSDLLKETKRDLLIEILKITKDRNSEKELLSELIRATQYHELRGFLTTQLNRTINRLKKQTYKLKRTSNYNLIVGLMATIVAVLVLVFMAYKADATKTDTGYLMKHYGSLLSVSLFIETLSFFFLRIYRQCLADIKYFENEITNCESKFVALDYALITNDTKTVSEILIKLASVERNFVLQKGESTIELEMIAKEREGWKSLADAASHIMSGIRGEQKKEKPG